MRNMAYRKLEKEEIEALEARMCSSSDWNDVEVAEGFSVEHVHSTRFSGKVRLGRFGKEFRMPGGIVKHSGLYNVTLHNVTVGDDCRVENVKNYIANYDIGHDCFIENVDIILTDGTTSFGNGVEVSVLNETGGREVMMHDFLSAHQAYVMALYRHRPELIEGLKKTIDYFRRFYNYNNPFI